MGCKNLLTRFQRPPLAQFTNRYAFLAAREGDGWQAATSRNDCYSNSRFATSRAADAL